MTFEQLEDKYRLTHGENNETIDATEEQALEYVYNQLLTHKSQKSLDDLTELYKLEYGEDGETIDANEELALEFAFNQIKSL